MNVYPNTIVYIACPAGTMTGGLMLLHQLGAALLARGFANCSRITRRARATSRAAAHGAGRGCMS